MQPVCAAALIANPALEPSLRAWLSEDLGRGDLTAPALVGARGTGSWIAKQAGILCGGVLVEPLFQLLDPAVTVQLLVADGEAVVAGAAPRSRMGRQRLPPGRLNVWSSIAR